MHFSEHTHYLTGWNLSAMTASSHMDMELAVPIKEFKKHIGVDRFIIHLVL